LSKKIDKKYKFWKILEKYGVWQDYKHKFIKKKYRDELFTELYDLFNIKAD
jgi:hypothetical protein